jgi:hypothetical protein
MQDLSVAVAGPPTAMQSILAKAHINTIGVHIYHFTLFDQ